MIKVRCFKCGNAFQLTEQFVANSLAVEGVTGRPSHYVANCPNCRQAIKVPLRGVHLPEAETQPGQGEEKGEGLAEG